MDIQQKRDFLMSLPLMEQEQQWIMERLDTLSVKEQHQLSAAILRTGKLEDCGQDRLGTANRHITHRPGGCCGRSQLPAVTGWL